MKWRFKEYNDQRWWSHCIHLRDVSRICIHIFSHHTYTSNLVYTPPTRYLHVAGQTYGRPIAGQYEVSGSATKSRSNFWQAMVCVCLSLHQVMSHCDVWWYHNDIIYSACKASLLPLACESLYNRRCYVSIRSAQLCILQVPLIVIFIGYSCFSTCLTFPFAGGSIHGATVIVSRTLRVVKLFSVLIVLGCHDSSHNKQQQNYSDIHPEGEDFMWRTPGFVLSPPQ